MAAAEPKKETEAAGGISKDAEEQLFNFAWHLKKQGYADSTIRIYSYYISLLVKRGADIHDPESVKEVLAKVQWKEGTKHIAINAYTKLLKYWGGSWEPPKVRVTRKLPFIPQEKEIDQLISGAGRKLACFLQLLKETGMRRGEAWRLKWTDVDFEASAIILNDPEKHGKPRVLKISPTLIAMLNRLPKKEERIFPGKITTLDRQYKHHRKRMAEKLQNPRLKRISFHTFRHWKATTLYHKTKDLLYVKELLGHRQIETTMLYVQLVNFEGDEYHSATARTVDEVRKLVDAGFEYVCDVDDVKFFRKRK